MTGCADSRGDGETMLARAERTARGARLFRQIADDAEAEVVRAYDRWKDAEARADTAEDEARRAAAALDGAA